MSGVLPPGCCRLAIADPPYPPFTGAGGRKNRASRWYGDKQRSSTDRPADHHPEAELWDDPQAHRELLVRLHDEYDGWAIATTPDGLSSYGPLPAACRIAAWVRPNAIPGAHRIRSTWEAVIVLPPIGRRSNRGGAGMVPDSLTASVPRGFRGAKPPEWTAWVLAMMSWRCGDQVDDLFRGSGAVSDALSLLGASAAPD